MSFVPEGYKSPFDLKQTEIAIKMLKDFFEQNLAAALNLTRVSAPLFVKPETGLNDNLNGIERPVSFGIREQNDACAEVVHSLAKWKRFALKRYGFKSGEGLYTDMNAIRRDEDTDNIHSLYVDQWDWEKIIDKSQRNTETLKSVVTAIYGVLVKTEKYMLEKFSFLNTILPEQITFVTSQEMEDTYPSLSPKEREYEYAKKYGAVFVMKIGGALKSGKPHDGRAPDYDDWNLNGDIILYYPVLDIAFEISSMGIRVDEEALKKQLEISGCYERAALPFQKSLLEGSLPYTVGGGIGQSRLCMFFLRKAHIGEVQSSIWTDATIKLCAEHGVELL